MKNLNISMWKEIAKVIYSFSSFHLGEDKREARARETRKTLKMVS